MWFALWDEKKSRRSGMIPWYSRTRMRVHNFIIKCFNRLIRTCLYGATFQWIADSNRGLLVSVLLYFALRYSKLAPLSQPIWCTTTTNHDLVTRVFPRSTEVWQASSFTECSTMTRCGSPVTRSGSPMTRGDLPVTQSGSTGTRGGLHVTQSWSPRTLIYPAWFKYSNVS